MWGMCLTNIKYNNVIYIRKYIYKFIRLPSFFWTKIQWKRVSLVELIVKIWLYISIFSITYTTVLWPNQCYFYLLFNFKMPLRLFEMHYLSIYFNILFNGMPASNQPHNFFSYLSLTPNCLFIYSKKLSDYY